MPRKKGGPARRHVYDIMTRAHGRVILPPAVINASLMEWNAFLGGLTLTEDEVAAAKKMRRQFQNVRLQRLRKHFPNLTPKAALVKEIMDFVRYADFMHMSPSHPSYEGGIWSIVYCSPEKFIPQTVASQTLPEVSSAKSKGDRSHTAQGSS